MSDLRLPVEIHPSVCVSDISVPAPDAPLPVQEHMSSLSALVGSAAGRGLLGPNAVTFLWEFAARHDAGYATDFGLLRTDAAQTVLRHALGEIGAAATPEKVTHYLHENQRHYLAARVIGHGIVGLVDNTLHYQARGVSFDRAFGSAALLAAHHPGFPITMVSTFVSGAAAIAEHERSSFLIDANGGDAEALRGRLIDVAADHLQAPRSAVARAAILGYAFDRITPGRTPNDVEVAEDGSTRVEGGEVIQKKYGLVAGDLLADASVDTPSIDTLYTTVIERLQTEAEAAIQAATYAGQSDLATFITAEAQAVIAQTRSAQAEAAKELHALGLSGSFKRLQTERPALLRAARKRRDERLRYALASYDAVISRVA